MANGQSSALNNNNNRQRAPRSQFHYFYGSTSDGSAAVTLSPPPPRTNRLGGDEGENVQQDQDSLVGEELISTDNEGEETAGLLNGRQKEESNGSLARHNVHPTCGVCSVALFLLVAGGMVVALILLIPHTSLTLPHIQTFTMPFPQVNRGEFGDPVNGFVDMDLFHPNLIAPPESPHAFVFPFPTGAFWTNLVVPSPQGALSYPIAVYPYAYRWSATSLQVSYPAGHRIVDKLTIQDAFAPDLKLSTVEEISNRYVTQFDPLSVTLRFVSTQECKWETALVQGSPYITLQYLKATPIIAPLSIFSNIQCPGDADENFSDLLEDPNSGSSGGGFEKRRRLFGVCSIDVRL
jgi:Glycosyl hydrolase family 81 N-terminal domain